MLKMIRNFVSRHAPVEDNSFHHIMSMAGKIATDSPEGLRELVRALLRPLQSELMVAVAERSNHEAPRDIRSLDFFFNLNEVAESSEFYLRGKPVVRVELSNDIVLPAPWRRNRFASALANIGTGKKNGTWSPDTNHSVTVWWPWRIAFVTGGNHSITAGILQGEGALIADEVYDLTPLFDRVTCDGKVYREAGTGRVIGQVTDPRRAAVFEIGRLMVKAGLTPK